MTSPDLEARLARLEAALRDSQARLGSMMAVASDLILILSQAGEYLEVTAPDPGALIAPEDRLLGATIHEVLPPEGAAVVQAVIDRALETGELQELEYELVVPDGVRVFHARVVQVAHRRGPAVLWIAREITEKKRAEAERLAFLNKVQAAQKLESLGVLASGIAHDFNNLLSGVLGNVGLVARHLPPGSPARPDLEAIEASAVRAAELCRELLAYAGRAERVVQLIDLSRLVAEAPRLLKASISKRSRLEVDLTDDLPPIRGDATQLRQVVLNLLTNASEAIEDEGTIQVWTRVRTWSEADLAQTLFEPTPAPGELVEVVVQDDGAGMDAETQRRMFDPFFTTKFTGRGLGLAAVMGIVRGHGGGLAVDSQPGQGTRITALFPPAEGQVTDEAAAPRVPVEAARGQRVLVADDDASVRRVAISSLREAGYDVVSAADGKAALAQFAEHQAMLACVLLDQTMPLLDGQGAIAEMRRIDPGVPIVLMSGFAEQDVLHGVPPAARPDAFLQKPFSYEGLLMQVQRVARKL